MGDQEGILRIALTNFLKKHSADESINNIDEIVLSYMVGVLEELGEDGAGDAFDLDGFIEMMDAYLPGFSNVNSMVVCEWMIELAAQLQALNNSGKPKNTLTQTLSSLVAPPPDKSLITPATPPVAPPTAKTQKSKGGRRSRKSSDKNSESERGAEASHHEVEQNGVFEESESVKVLQEMFPTSCSLEVSHCLDVSNGDLEAAAQLMLARQERGEHYTSNAAKPHRTSAKKQDLSKKEDSKLKKSIISKYSYVDMDEDKKQHRPVMPRYDDKKLTRYLDNKVVSTKGERFTEIKRDDQDEITKKTTVNLKPAKQYRFH